MNSTMQEKLQPYLRENGYYDEARIANDFDGADPVQARYLAIFGEQGDEDVSREPSDELKAAREFNKAKVAQDTAAQQAQEDEILSAEPLDWKRVPEYMMDFADFEETGVQLKAEYRRRRNELLNH